MLNRDAYKYSTILLVLIPVLAWHFLNQALPTSDGVGYMYDAFDRYFNLQDNFFSGLVKLYLSRGWRPIIYPLFVVPFLIISGGNIFFAVGATCVLFTGLLAAYLYKLFRLFLAPYISMICSALIVLSPYFFGYTYNFFSELSYTCFCTIFVYYILTSNFWDNKRNSILAGIFFGVALCIRPAEITYFIPGLLFFVWLSFKKGMLTKTDLFKAVSFCGILLAFMLLTNYILSTFFEGITKKGIICVLVLGSLYPLYKSYLNFRKSGFLIFVFTAATFLYIYWFPFIEELKIWVHAATVGEVVKTLGTVKRPILESASAATTAWNNLFTVIGILFIFSIFKPKNFIQLLKDNRIRYLLVSSISMFGIFLFSIYMTMPDYQEARRSIFIMILFLTGSLILTSKTYKDEKLTQWIKYTVLTVVFIIQYTSLWFAIVDKKKPQFFSTLPISFNYDSPQTVSDYHIALNQHMTHKKNVYGISKNWITLYPLAAQKIDPFATGVANFMSRENFWMGFSFLPEDADPEALYTERKVGFLLVEKLNISPELLERAKRAATFRYAYNLAQKAEQNKLSYPYELIDTININGTILYLIKFIPGYVKPQE